MIKRRHDRKPAQKDDRIITDTVVALMEEARHQGQREERQRVLDYLRQGSPREQQLAVRFEAGDHDPFRRRFKAYSWSWPDEGEALPAVGDTTALTANHAATTPQEAPCQSHSTKGAQPLPVSNSKTKGTTRS